jgi:hypothetical protein
MKRTRGLILMAAIGLPLAATALVSPVLAEEEELGAEGELAKQTQNPVANLISVPIQANITLEVGPDEDPLTVINVQPVFPQPVGKWNLIHRPIVPLKDQPRLFPGGDDETGIGDINYQLFVSPAQPGKFIWGVGPVLGFPTATEDILGTEKWTVGPALLGLTMRGRWVIGALFTNSWDYAGDDDRADVNFMTFQYFANYNFDKGWYVSSAPIMTANWEASSGQKWTVPIGGGGGKITKWGKRPVNLSAQVFYHLEAPDDVGDWALRFQLQLLYPKGK